VSERLWRRAVLVLAVLVFGFTAHGYVENTDAQVTLHAARAFWARGTSRLVADRPDATDAERILVRKIVEEKTLGMPAADGDGVYVWFPIGHQALFLPAVALGALHDRLFPDLAASWDRSVQPLYRGIYGARFFASFVSPLFAALGLWSIVVLARALGRTRAQALGIAVLTCLATQFWPATNETLSDTPGTGLFLAALAFVVHGRVHGVGWRAGLVAGLLSGGSVLVRYPQALPVLGLSAWLVVDALRDPGGGGGGWRRLVGFVLGGVPAFALLLVANLWRFGSVLETGYSAGADAGWMAFPVYLGVPLILFATGKGLLVLSPVLWLALARLRHRAVRCRANVRASFAVFVATLFLLGHSVGWGSGQCWGVRYLTPAVVWFVAATLCAGPPVRFRAPGTLVCGVLGVVISLGGLVTPYVGHTYLATRAAAVYAQEFEGGPPPLDFLVEVFPRFSVVHGHWNYARLAASGRIESGRSEDTTEPLFGIATPEPNPLDWTDVRFRHVWWRGRSDLAVASGASGVAAPAVALIWLAAMLVLVRWVWRGALDEPGRDEADAPAGRAG
jgi:hypothetical protein